MFKKHLTHAKAFMTGHFRDIGLDVGIFSQIRLDFQLFPTWELFIPSVGITVSMQGTENPLFCINIQAYQTPREKTSNAGSVCVILSLKVPYFLNSLF